MVDVGVSDGGGSGDCVGGGGDCEGGGGGGGDCVKGGGGLDKTEVLPVRRKDCPHMDTLVTVQETAVCCMLYVLGLNVRTYCLLYFASCSILS